MEISQQIQAIASATPASRQKAPVLHPDGQPLNNLSRFTSSLKVNQRTAPDQL